MSCRGSPLSTWMAAHAPGLSLVAHVLATWHCASRPGHLHVIAEGTPDWTVTCPWSCPKAAGWAPASSLHLAPALAPDLGSQVPGEAPDCIPHGTHGG